MLMFGFDVATRLRKSISYTDTATTADWRSGVEPVYIFLSFW